MRRHREQLSAFAQRSKEVLLLAAGSGAITGFVVGLFERVVVDGIDRINAAPLWVGATMPFVGLAVAARLPAMDRARDLTGDAPTSTCTRSTTRSTNSACARSSRGCSPPIATLGSGCPMGLEGPSLYGGATLGDRLHRRLPRLFSAQNRRVLLVAGAAAGVAAIFKAPATGAVFALEVPYQDDLARRMLLPALVASASGYLTFVALHGTAPLLPVFGTAPFSTKDLVGAVIVGLLAGLGARVFSHMIRASKRIADRVSPWWRVPAAGSVDRTLLRRVSLAHRPQPGDGNRLRHDPVGARAVARTLDHRRDVAPALPGHGEHRRGRRRRRPLHPARGRRRARRGVSSAARSTRSTAHSSP